MTVNELIVQLDLLPADAEVTIRLIDTDEPLTSVHLADSGEVVLESAQTAV
jgi:predicted transcriptional regulator